MTEQCKHVWARGDDGFYPFICSECNKRMTKAEALTRLNATERFVAFMDEYYSIRGKIEPLKSDTEEDRTLKAIYADILEGKDE